MVFALFSIDTRAATCFLIDGLLQPAAAAPLPPLEPTVEPLCPPLEGRPFGLDIWWSDIRATHDGAAPGPPNACWAGQLNEAADWLKVQKLILCSNFSFSLSLSLSPPRPLNSQHGQRLDRRHGNGSVADLRDGGGGRG